jgi:hypothetical protein
MKIEKSCRVDESRTACLGLYTPGGSPLLYNCMRGRGCLIPITLKYDFNCKQFIVLACILGRWIVFFKQFDWLLSSRYPCTIHFPRIKTKWLPSLFVPVTDRRANLQMFVLKPNVLLKRRILLFCHVTRVQN